jgi:hypothetical protein
MLTWLQSIVFDGTSPLGGLTRIVFYSALLFPDTTDRPWNIGKVVRAIPSELVNPTGLLSLFPRSLALEPSILDAVALVTRLALVCSALGFGGHLPVCVSAVGWVWLVNAIYCMDVFSKKYLATAWTLFFLCFSSARGELSVDQYLSTLSPNYPFTPLDPSYPSIFRSGFGPSMSFWTMAFIFCGAGVTKFRDSGLAWGLGMHPLVLLNQHNARLPLVASLLCRFRTISDLLGTSTVVLETLAPVGIFFPVLRVPLAVTLLGLQAGISAVLQPVFFHHIMAYIVMLEWQPWLCLPSSLPVTLSTALPHDTVGFGVGLALACAVAWTLSTVFPIFSFHPFVEYAFYCRQTHMPLSKGEVMAAFQEGLNGKAKLRAHFRAVRSVGRFMFNREARLMVIGPRGEQLDLASAMKNIWPLYANGARAELVSWMIESHPLLKDHLASKDTYRGFLAQRMRLDWEGTRVKVQALLNYLISRYSWLAEPTKLTMNVHLRVGDEWHSVETVV